MKVTPDFYMSTAGEYGPLAAPRSCWQLGRLRDDVHDEYMLIKIEPPLNGQLFDLGATDIAQLIISPRHRGQTLYPVSEWPLFVYVARVKDQAVFKSYSFKPYQVELVAWGVLFRTSGEAFRHARRFEQ